MPAQCPLVVGCPVFERGWILPKWCDSFEAQNFPEGARVIFAYSQGSDDTYDVIASRMPDAEILPVDDLPAYHDHQRDDDTRYGVLAEIRNRLLEQVRRIGPALYLSWDSDIELEPEATHRMAIASAFHNTSALGALVDMGGHQRPGHWSWMTLDGDDAFRPEARPVPTVVGGHQRPFQVGVVMGVVMMTPTAYCVRYSDHILGEDVGWAINARAAGVERILVPTARGEHHWRL